MASGIWRIYIAMAGLCLSAASLAAVDGRVFHLEGRATVNGYPMTLASKIRAGDVIETQRNSSVKIIMSDRSVLDIGANTEFKISGYQFEKKKPSKWGSTFSLLKGAFRFVSGLIASTRPKKVAILTGGLTLGLRGTFSTFSFDGVSVSVYSSIGTAIVRFPDGSSFTIAVGKQGTIDAKSGNTSLRDIPVGDPISVAAANIAASVGDADSVGAALAGKSDADQAMVLAVLMNNAGALGVSDMAQLATVVGNASAASTANAALFVFVASALDPDNSARYAEQAKLAAPDQATSIDRAADLGSNVDETPPASGLTGPSSSELQKDIEQAVADGKTIEEVLAELLAANPELATDLIAAALAAFPNSQDATVATARAAGVAPSVISAALPPPPQTQNDSETVKPGDPASGS